MQPIIIHIEQGDKECEAIVMEGLDGKIHIDIKFRPTFPTLRNTLFEKLAYAMYSEIKKKNNE